MSFQDPLHLLALVALPLVFLFWQGEQRRRRAFAIRHPAAGMVVRTGVGRGRSWRRVLPATLLAFAALGLAVAFARPTRTVEVPVDKAAIMLVTDQSGSMLADDVSPTRIDAAKSAARTFVDELPDELLVGFESYSSGVVSVVDPTTDHDEVRDAIAGVEANGGTATGEALTAALDRLEARKTDDGRTAPAAIVLLSDGKNTEGVEPLVPATRAQRLSIPIYTVALGTDDGYVQGPNGEILAVPPDRETLRLIAQRSGGRAFEAAESGELDAVYRALGSRIGTREEDREITTAFAGGALLLLLAGLGTGLRWRGRLV
jgi:Ca-activated chloride channel homolog